jgi:hypothetical protein
MGMGLIAAWKCFDKSDVSPLAGVAVSVSTGMMISYPFTRFDDDGDERVA